MSEMLFPSRPMTRRHRQAGKTLGSSSHRKRILASRCVETFGDGLPWRGLRTTGRKPTRSSLTQKLWMTGCLAGHDVPS